MVKFTRVGSSSISHQIQCLNPLIKWLLKLPTVILKVSSSKIPRCGQFGSQFWNMLPPWFLAGWWFGTWILFSHILGLSSSHLTFDFHIFQTGSNHQPVGIPFFVEMWMNQLHFPPITFQEKSQVDSAIHSPVGIPTNHPFFLSSSHLTFIFFR